MSALRLLLLILFALAPSTGATATGTAVSETGEIRFVARYEALPLDGVFKRFRVEMTVDRATDEPRALRVVVATGSADMNDRDVNAELKTPAFFAAERFPEAVFSSPQIRREPDGSYVATGTLELKGASRPLTVPFRLSASTSGRELSGEVTVSRLDWNVGQGEWAATDRIAAAVEIRFRIEFAGEAP